MTYFIQCIQDYGSKINYDKANSKIVYKYLFKAFYKKINKKKYESEILEYNICHTNVIAIQNVILIAKIPVRSVKKKEFVIDTFDAEITRVCSTTNILLKYN